jgi:hypothetical protein
VAGAGKVFSSVEEVGEAVVIEALLVALRSL